MPNGTSDSADAECGRSKEEEEEGGEQDAEGVVREERAGRGGLLAISSFIWLACSL